jgi:CRISPR-associated protein Cas1
MAVDAVPDYVPARMLNEFVYCPRLFYYEWVEKVFADNRETVEGALRHSKIDSHADALAPADALSPDERVHSRSVSLSSETHRVIATIDLVEADGQSATPVDYKRGAPRKNAESGLPEAWDPDRVQVAVQALVLRDGGYTCSESVIYYVKTKQRVRVTIDDALVAATLQALAQARVTAAAGTIPPPLVDSPKCPRCSLVGICLPDETRFLQEVDHQADQRAPAPGAASGGTAAGGGAPPRRLVAARDDLRPLYLNSQGLQVGKSGNVLKVKEGADVVQEVRIGETCQVSLFGNIQLTTQALHALCEHEVPIAYFSQAGWFYGITHGLGVRNIALRREQFRRGDDPDFCLRIARSLIAGKIRNQRTMLQRNHVEPPVAKIAQLKCFCDDADRAESAEQLLGIEGNAARIYFELFPGMIKVGNARSAGDILADELLEQFNGPADGDEARAREAAAAQAQAAEAAAFRFDFTHRNRRPPRDPVNALLSLAYSVLAKDLTVVCNAVGFDAFLGYFHQPRFGRASLALDLMEPFRPLIADSAVLSAINTRMVTTKDFIQDGPAVALKPEGRKGFFRAYEQRMDTLATHPLFAYRLNYRRMLEIQTRLLARVVTGEISSYPVFVTR